MMLLRVSTTRTRLKPFQPDYNNSCAVQEYNSTIQATGRHLKDQLLFINRQEYANGYTLYAFNLAPDDGYSQHLSLIKTGNVIGNEIQNPTTQNCKYDCLLMF